MTEIYQTLADPEVPRGGTVRDSIGWMADVPLGTHVFYLLSFYGVGTTVEEILNQIVASNFITVDTMSQSRVDNVDTVIANDAALGTYSCATIIAENFDGSTITLVYDAQVDVDVLTITPGDAPEIGATIISTAFTSV